MNISNIYRDRTLDMMNEENVGETVRVAGWVENIRDHGGVSFIDLRDMYGVLQVVMRDTTLLEGINKEDCISIEGVIDISPFIPFSSSFFLSSLLLSIEMRKHIIQRFRPEQLN